MPKILSPEFYMRDPAKVAKNLLGKKLVRVLGDFFLKGIIVETEAYYGLKDPASRAYSGIKSYNKLMWGIPGAVFIYNVHKYWMFNIVSHKSNEIGAVLIRALEPTDGIDLMMKNRPVKNILNLTNGPGKLTLALNIDKNLHKHMVTSCQGHIYVEDHKLKFKIGSSHRIGVKKDLKKNLRFFIHGNTFVSRI
jgi:DNA-3-methyladenine glycosylase